MSDAGARSREIIDVLGLEPHPERGYYVESYRARERVTVPSRSTERAAATAIYFLVTREERVTSLHRLRSDEVFHLYEGGPLDVLQLFADGRWAVARLGLALREGERPQLMIPAGTWFGTELVTRASHCLIGCTVAPGFEFDDFELGNTDSLVEEYPAAREHIRRFRRPDEP